MTTTSPDLELLIAGSLSSFTSPLDREEILTRALIGLDGKVVRAGSLALRARERTGQYFAHRPAD